MIKRYIEETCPDSNPGYESFRQRDVSRSLRRRRSFPETFPASSSCSWRRRMRRRWPRSRWRRMRRWWASRRSPFPEERWRGRTWGSSWQSWGRSGPRSGFRAGLLQRALEGLEWLSARGCDVHWWYLLKTGTFWVEGVFSSICANCACYPSSCMAKHTFYRKICFVAALWGTWCTTDKIEKRREKPSTRRDSNPQPQCHKVCALPLCFNSCPRVECSWF